MKEEEAWMWFVRARFADNKGKPYCPRCGNLNAPLAIRRRRWRCVDKACGHEFSATSGTILANRKLSFRTLLMALALSVHSVKDKAACELKRELGVDYKTAFVLLHKLREAVAAQRKGMKLEGVVEMDGMYVGGHIRPKNRKENRVDRRHAENQTGKRMAIIVMRERRPNGLVLALRAPDERGDVAWHLVKNHLALGGELRADQHKSYDELVGLAVVVRNDHSVAYVERAEASTNQAESFFSRARRAETGTHHRMAGKYLDWYAADLGWRETRRRQGFRHLAKAVLSCALGHGISRNMAGYWQRTGKAAQDLVGWSPLEGMGVPAAT